jgi:hypothetical protein
MNSRRNRILRVLSSIAGGIMAFCLSFPAAMLLGALLLRPQQRDTFFSPEVVGLFLLSSLVACAVAVLAGMKYYRYLEQ